MSNSPNLQLPYIAVAQSQKEVTHNEALNILDAITQLKIVDRDLSTPPVTPTNGDCYIVSTSPTGAWTDYEGYIAAYYDGWLFISPEAGFKAWILDEDLLLLYDGDSWEEINVGNFNNNIANYTSDHTITISEDNTFFTNSGATEEVEFNLPASATTFRSVEYTFYIAAAYNVKINCPASTTIRHDENVCTTAGNFYASTVGRLLKVKLINSTTWIVTEIIGIWSYT